MKLDKREKPREPKKFSMKICTGSRVCQNIFRRSILITATISISKTLGAMKAKSLQVTLCISSSKFLVVFSNLVSSMSIYEVRRGLYAKGGVN